MALLQINEGTCNRCGACANVCPNWLIEMQAGNFPKPVTWIDDACFRCGHCVSVCPTDSIKHIEVPVEKCPLVEENLKVTREQCAQLLTSRRSIRSYKKRPVARGMITQLIEIARYAPTAHNCQDVEWLVIDKSDDLLRIENLGIDWMRWVINNQPQLASTYHMEGLLLRQEKNKNTFLRGAPVLIIVHSAVSQPGLIHGAHALAFLDLVANSSGLGCCWAAFTYLMANTFPPIKELFSIPQGNSVYGCMRMGYPKYSYKRIPFRKEARIAWH